MDKRHTPKHLQQPALPAIGIHQKDYLSGVMTEEAIRKLNQTTLLGYLKHRPGDCLYFDSLGKRWRLHYRDATPSYQKNWWNTLLAQTIYNPWVKPTIGADNRVGIGGGVSVQRTENTGWKVH